MANKYHNEIHVIVDNEESVKYMNIKLPTGAFMPLVGFGTYTICGEDLALEVLDHALSVGYRLFDTSTMYENEKDLGAAFKALLPKHNLSRKDIFITTKLVPSDHGEKAYKAIKNSLRALNCEYIDLYLIHWPGVEGIDPSSPENAKLRDISWQQMVKAVKNGLVKHIGVSNYNMKHLGKLLANDHGIRPVVNQVEWHPLWHQDDLLNMCKKEGIQLQAYMSLGGTGEKGLVSDPTVLGIAAKLGRTPGQILLRWALQQGVAIIPKSRSKEHIYKNFELNFSIPEEDMQTLSTFKKQQKFDWDPDTIY